MKLARLFIFVFVVVIFYACKNNPLTDSDSNNPNNQNDSDNKTLTKQECLSDCWSRCHSGLFGYSCSRQCVKYCGCRQELDRWGNEIATVICD